MHYQSLARVWRAGVSHTALHAIFETAKPLTEAELLLVAEITIDVAESTAWRKTN